MSKNKMLRCKYCAKYIMGTIYRSKETQRMFTCHREECTKKLIASQTRLKDS